MRDIATLVQHVRSQGGKVTSQRILIWQSLINNREHPTAEELYVQLKPALPGLSMTTLYSALNELVEWGEVKRFDSGDRHIHFDPDVTPHAELICLHCHTVIDAPEIEVASHVPTEIAGFEILNRAEQYYGFCPTCRTQRSVHTAS